MDALERTGGFAMKRRLKTVRTESVALVSCYVCFCALPRLAFLSLPLMGVIIGTKKLGVDGLTACK